MHSRNTARTGDVLADTPEAWQEKAEFHEGSWWTDWQAWIDALNRGERVAARTPGAGKLEVIEDAPGSYVSMRLDATQV